MTELSNQDSLEPRLGFQDAVSLVVGTVIGSGVFMKAAVMTQDVGSFAYVMLAWIFAGLLSLAGALCYAELGSRYPEAGGEYVYLREAFGELISFLNGWMRFAIGNPGSIAAYAVGCMTCLSGVFHLSPFAQTGLACVSIAIFTAINCLNVHAAGSVQTLMSAVKMLLVVGFTFALMRPTASSLPLDPSLAGWPGWRAFGSAMLAALWCYDGWNGMPMAASEVRNPQKIIPRALIVGMVAVMAIYLLVNVGFFRALSVVDIARSNSPVHPDALPVATNAALASLGGGFAPFVSFLLAFSALVALNGSVLTGARVAFAMARDGIFFRSLGAVSHQTHTPLVSIIVQGAISILIACSGSFDQLTNYVMFSSWIFYALSIGALFVLRRKNPTASGFRTPLYPILPLAFLFVSVWLVVSTLATAPTESAVGLALIAAGTPIFVYFRRRHDAGLRVNADRGPRR